VLTKLRASEETGFSRIQALIMQNYGGNTLYTALNSESQLNINKHDEACTAHYLDLHKKTPIHQIAVHNFRDWSIKHEINQLKKRSQRFNKWIH
jgi:predicted GIY-YIG superfamily endonuclease